MKVLGVILIIAGICLGIYAGLWLCFIGGIIQIVNAVQSSPVSGMDIAIGIVRIIGAGLVGTLTAFVAVIPGFAMVSAN